MSTTLRSALDALATQFADGVLRAIRTASLDDLQAEAGGSGRSARSSERLPRRSHEQIEAILAKVIGAVKKTKGKGMRAEQIRKALNLDVREMPRVLKEGLKTKKLKAKGRKRATVYRAA